jgi:site-specific DNA-methyltransferase (adenine-specific)/modification methylase
MILKEERIGGQRLILGDCLQVMPMLGRFDACVTDPPYGIGYDASAAKNSNTQFGKAFAAKTQYRATSWDSKTCDQEVAFAVALAQKAIVFGGNYYQLGPSSGWLVWDKEINGNFADCELAWSNIDQPARLLRHMWNGGIRKGQEAKHGHPTQKPVALMEWCLGFLPNAQTILDPFMGSGTTLVACQRMGRNGTGIELDPDYFAIACKRVDEASRQPDLLIDPPKPQPVQEGFDL